MTQSAPSPTSPKPATFSQFNYGPGTPTPPPEPPPTPTPIALGPLTALPGSWKGTGFNTIWRPSHSTQDRFLELNVTSEELDFDSDGLGSIPNRGFLQDDIFMTGVRYLQRITDTVLNQGIHIEPGLWLTVPPTTAPKVDASVVRMASIPHGTTVVAQGTAETISAAPTIAPASITPFSIGQGPGTSPFPEQNLSIPSSFRSPIPSDNSITQQMVDDPNSVLRQAVGAQTISSSTILTVSSADAPVLGGGTANTAFLQGDPNAGPNARASLVTATFWIETLAGLSEPTQLQYSQTVLLDFNGISWPHVSVATLQRVG